MISSYQFLAVWLRARFGDREHGASLVEYTLLVGLIALVCIAAVTLLGDHTSSKLDSIGQSLN
jgi:Flp pilus assembly pilin Flp